MSKSDGPTVVQIDMKDFQASDFLAIGDLDFGHVELPKWSAAVTNRSPIALEGTFDDNLPSFFALDGEASRKLTIVQSRRFLWWEVSSQRIKQTVILQAHSVTQEPDGAITYSVPMKLNGPCEAIRSPWWERTLYAIAGIWSR